MTSFRGGPRRLQQQQRGTSLLEALVGFALVAVGMLGSAQLQLQLRQSVALSRQQADAVRLAQQEIETLRGFVTHENRPGLASFESITSSAASVDAAPGSPTAYRIARQIRDSISPLLKELEIRVDWTDRHGITHRRSLFTMLGGQAPALILPLGQKSAAGHAGPVLGRHAAIPRDAHDLGSGRSVFKPVTAGSEAWLFDNRSARIVARCGGVPVNRVNRQLSAADLSDCHPTHEMLLAGRIRHFLPAAPTLPDAVDARDTPLPMSAALQLSSVGHAQPARCLGEAVRMVEIGTAGAPRPIAVAIDATAASQDLITWTELDDRYWRYHCAVSLAPALQGSPSTPPHWIGRLQITPHGWTIGTTPGSRQICRYSADTDNNGSINSAAESPDNPVAVTEALIEQNYLVIDGSQSCPTRPAAHTAAANLPWSHINPATVPHQR